MVLDEPEDVLEAESWTPLVEDCPQHVGQLKAVLVAANVLNCR